MNKSASTALYILLAIVCVAVACIIIQDGSNIIADLGKHIMNLFRRANLFPGSHGFNEFIQLILIAVFVGWAISRFKNNSKD